MFAALPLILSLAPEIARWIGGSQAGTVTAAIAGAVKQVAGTDDPDAAAAALSADPAKTAELRIKLAQIAADAEAAQRQADLDSLKAEFAADAARRQAELETLRAQIADAGAARTATADLVKANSLLAWGSPVLSIIIVLSFAVMVWFVINRQIGEANLPLANVLLGTLAALATQVSNYWLGSSSGSRNKDALLQHAQDQLAMSIPSGAIPRPGAIVATGGGSGGGGGGGSGGGGGGGTSSADDLNAAQLVSIRARP